MNYAPIIGLEVHAELTTESKLFCRCPNTSNDLQTPPNTAICPVCVGLPGALPVLNRKAVVSTIALGRSVGSTIPTVTKWDRKNYFYPDLPKGYQISQYDQPLCQGGEVRWFDREGNEHAVALTRIHLEEDTGKLTHPEGTDYSLIDYNRSSIPLLELVTEPVISSADEAKQFCEEYQLRLRELGIAEASMEKGQMRCEANISVVPEEWATDPHKRLSGKKVEIKNLNSFRSLERAIRYEIERQSRVLSEGGTLRQETRGWNEVKGETYVMRTKETAEDYRYFPEPDLGQLDLEEFMSEAPESVSRYDLFTAFIQSGSSAKDVFTLVNDPSRRAFLEKVLTAGLNDAAKPLAIQWINQEPKIMTFTPEEVAAGLTALANQSVRPSLFKEVLLTATPGTLQEALAQGQENHTVENLDGIVQQVLQSHPDELARYKNGQVQLFGFFVGQVRKVLAGKGDPVAIAETLKRALE